MAAPKANKYWEFRDKHGRDHKYKPEGLWEEAVKYFVWVQDNPLWESVVIAKGITVDTGKKDEFDKPIKKIVHTIAVPKMRAMTIVGFCLFADICEKTFANYRDDKDFVQVVTRIEKTIYAQKFEGAAATLLNPNIIARDLGLADKKEIKQDTTVSFEEKTDDELDKEIEDLTDNK